MHSFSHRDTHRSVSEAENWLEPPLASGLISDASRCVAGLGATENKVLVRPRIQVMRPMIV